MNGSASQKATRRKADLRRSLSLSTAEGLVATPIVTLSLPVNVFLTALVTQAFPLSKSAIGLFTALPFLANFLQIFVVPALSRWRPPKTVSILAAGLHTLTWAALGVGLPYLPIHDPVRAGVCLIAWFLVSSFFTAVMGVTWNSWIQDWVPHRVRGKYFGRRNRLIQFSTTAFLLSAGWVIGHWHFAIPAFQGVIAVTVVLRLFCLRWQWISPTRPLRQENAAPLSLAAQVGAVRRAGSLLAFVAFGCVWSFAANCFGPFYQVFMFEQTHLSGFAVGLTATLAQLGGALSLPAWGALLDRYGNKAVMSVSLVLWQVSNFTWLLVGPSNRALLFPLWLWGGATSAGFILGQFTILLRIIPREAKDLAIGTNLAVTSLFAAMAPVLGGYFLEYALAKGGSALAVYHRCFLLQPVLALAGAFLLLRIREPAASPLGAVVGAMRNIRTLSGVLGLDFLSYYSFFRPATKGGSRQGGGVK